MSNFASPIPKPERPQYTNQQVPTETPPATYSTSTPDMVKVADIIGKVDAAYSRKLVGQKGLKTTLLIGLIAGGHVLLESLPGLAKTTAAQSLAESVHASFKRIQCTPDLLPSDIIGTQIFNQDTHSFETKLGPVHANFVLLDEINRSSAKTQSAMLEAMQEKQTSIGGEVHRLPSPFMVIATQNPIEQEGTYRLPEAQLDRFLLKEVVTYPTMAEELTILERVDSGVLESDYHTDAAVSLQDVARLQNEAKKVRVSQNIYKYVINIVNATRNVPSVLGPEMDGFVQYGGSPRASIAFLKSARALALLSKRDYVVPEDIKALRHVVLRHRVVVTYEAEAEGVTSENLVDRIFERIPTP